MTYLNNRLPRWMTERVDYGDGNFFRASFFDSNHPTDHFEQRKNDKGEIEYISQPYGLSYGSIKTMVNVCEKYGIAFDIDGDSDHLPGSTVMIRWRKQEQAPHRHKSKSLKRND